MTQDPRQPLTIDPADRVSLQDIKHRAEEITNLATAETKRVKSAIVEAELSKVALVAVGVILVVASLAYLRGARSARRAFAATGE